MPRPRPPYLRRERTRHGAVAWYFRRGDGKRIRIRGDYGSQEFMAAYRAAIAGQVQGAKRAASGTLAWLIERYKDSGEWARLAPATQEKRRNILRRVCETAGEIRFSKITKREIVAGRDRRKATPFAANDFLKAMRALFRFALKADYVRQNPTDDVEGLGHKTEGFHTWTDDEIATFEARWPIGTRERLALAILLYTGLRRGDAARLGRQHVKDGMITFRTAKTAALLTIPMLPELADIIAATRIGDLAFIATASGRPMTKESFGNWFKEACVAAGVPGTAHGLRKAGATICAYKGFTEAQLRAWYGWGETSREPARYTRAANRIRLATEGMEKLKRG